MINLIVRKFRARIEPNKVEIPKRVLQVIEEELTKLKALKVRNESCIAGSDSSVTRDYLDWLTALPWGAHSYENCDVMHAKKILDENHYGLSDVKERVLEHVAVEKLRGTSQGKIICLSGPPGVGKTSIARSIAHALHRNFFRFNVGGVNSVADIKGIRRTVCDAMPGRMVQCLKSVGTTNPVVLIEEIDQIGRSNTSDTLNALFEILDPELNAHFMDHYLDVTIDLSKVLFVCTGDAKDVIPRPLLNRMEVITIRGYVFDEKMRIARDYLEKTASRDCGISPEQVDVSDAALCSLIENYCKEEGVGNLQKQIEKIYRKSALKLVREGESDTTIAETVKKVSIDNSNLVDYVGRPVFLAKKTSNEKTVNVYKIYEQTPVGVVGCLTTKRLMYIETNIVKEEKGKGDLHVMTGHFGDAMKESANVACTVARRFLLEKEPKNPFFADSKLHLHIPAAVRGQDGPSGGCPMITSLLSLAIKKPVRKDLAMTGEVTLTGKILPIGGVKEKTLAARRSQIKTIIFPEGNRRDFDELAENVKEGFDVHFVDKIEQIFELAFNYDH